MRAGCREGRGAVETAALPVAVHSRRERVAKFVRRSAIEMDAVVAAVAKALGEEMKEETRIWRKGRRRRNWPPALKEEEEEEREIFGRRRHQT